MAGHSKWANIKHKKAAADAKRGKAFTKLIKEITVCAKVAGKPDVNPRLRQLIEKAKDINMPADNIARAVKKGTGELPGVAYEAITYEGYGPNGVAVIMETLTDNKNRTVADLRTFFSKRGGTIGETGSVNWMFERKGVLKGYSNKKTEDDFIELLLDYEVDNISVDDDIFFITCEPKSLDEIKKILEDANFKVDNAELEWVAKNTVSLDDQSSEKVIEFLDELEDLDDIQNVYANLV
jgi:YebC/PmpR family DNA-binding regulatory protein